MTVSGVLSSAFCGQYFSIAVPMVTNTVLTRKDSLTEAKCICNTSEPVSMLSSAVCVTRLSLRSARAMKTRRDKCKGNSQVKGKVNI